MTLVACCGFAAPVRAQEPVRELAALELGLGCNFLDSDDEFLRRAQSFDFGAPYLPSMRTELGLAFDLVPQLALAVSYARVDKGSFTRHGFARADGGTLETPDQSFAWTTGLLALSVRVQVPVVPEVRPYLQLGGGLGITRTAFDALELGTEIHVEEQLKLGPGFTAELGVQLMPVRFFGFYVASGLSYVTALENALGELRAPLAAHITAGLRLAWTPAAPDAGTKEVVP